jgi:hypothetical protein
MMISEFHGPVKTEGAVAVACSDFVRRQNVHQPKDPKFKSIRTMMNMVAKFKIKPVKYKAGHCSRRFQAMMPKIIPHIGVKGTSKNPKSKSITLLQRKNKIPPINGAATDSLPNIGLQGGAGLDSTVMLCDAISMIQIPALRDTPASLYSATP